MYVSLRIVERIQIMKSSAEMQGREVDNLQKRNQQLQDISRRAEIEAHHSMEQLLEANSLSERLRNEAALLRAEQGLWKVSNGDCRCFPASLNFYSQNVEARLTAENQSLARERANINELMKQYQTMQADLERSAENDKRRLEAQVQEQDNQLCVFIPSSV
jgi:nucleoprotein TPR